MFENKMTKAGIHYSRYIASWKNAGGSYTYLFEEWLKHLGCTDEEISDMKEMYNCGKLELETDAKLWLHYAK